MNTKKRADLCRKLRKTVREFGNKPFYLAVMVGPEQTTSISDISYLYCPTLPCETLGNVSMGIARFFEEA